MNAPPHAADRPADQLSDFVPLVAFAREYERQGLGTKDSLRWLARYRAQNGLLKTGAVVELRTPGARRPRLLINRPRFVAWLAGKPCAA
jgi:hypothetical protein